MGEQNKEKKATKHICVGLLAHVDAGKTTLSEAMLYCGGCIKKLGRVDHQNAFLDTDTMEKERGITIFSKQAKLELPDWDITLMDTPGHMDFSGEMERTLQVLDYAVLVISGSDGVQSHTQTVWKLLQQYKIPTFLFVNKIDLAGVDQQALILELKKRLSDGCVPFLPEMESVWEELSMQDEDAMEEYLQTERLSRETVARIIAERKVFPCYFGSALKLQGVEEFLQGICQYAKQPVYEPEFKAKVYKISRDPQGNRLTYLKVTGGCLKVKTMLSSVSAKGVQWQEKADQIRIYSGAKFVPAEQVAAGTICAVTGLTKTMPGDGLGQETSSRPPILEPVMSCRLHLPAQYDVHNALMKLSQLEEEDPQLHLVWDERLGEIHLQMMGEVQLDVLKRKILERFGMSVGFGQGSILYKETISKPVVGIGHFEPLRHYAEVHLLLEPAPTGSGLTFATNCPENTLDKNWQNLVLTHLAEKEHRGVLTASPITDMKITLIAGKAHLKHTEGGDFRQATYRAVRHGLMQAESVLLEPWYDFRIELPTEQVGRAMADVQRMGGEFSSPQTQGEETVLQGMVPAAFMQGYQMEIISYTKGRGKLFCVPAGYRPCHNAQEVIEQIGYDSEHDVENTANSVFCSHGAGFTVHWSEVQRYAHIDTSPRFEPEPSIQKSSRPIRIRSSKDADDKELAEIFERTYGAVKRRELFRTELKPQQEYVYQDQGPEYLLVDGYNIIFAWDDLKQLAQQNLEAARQALADILCNYQGFKQCYLILVFDAYKVARNVGEVSRYNNIHIVYTKEAETADMYIEKVTYQLKGKHRVKVATSDSAEQLIILGHGASRLSANMLREEIERTNNQIRQIIEKKR